MILQTPNIFELDIFFYTGRARNEKHFDEKNLSVCIYIFQCLCDQVYNKVLQALLNLVDPDRI